MATVDVAMIGISVAVGIIVNYLFIYKINKLWSGMLLIFSAIGITMASGTGTQNVYLLLPATLILMGSGAILAFIGWKE